MLFRSSGSLPHLALELLKSAAKVDMLHVPYKGAAPAVADVVAGTVQVLLIGLPTVMPQVNAGKVIALGVPTPQPSPLAPGVPTLAESAGLPGFEMSNWLGFVAPSATPRGLVTKLNSDIVGILRMPDVRAQLLKGGFEPTGSTIEQFQTQLETGLKSWAKVVKEAGITID